MVAFPGCSRVTGDDTPESLECSVADAPNQHIETWLDRGREARRVSGVTEKQYEGFACVTLDRYDGNRVSVNSDSYKRRSFSGGEETG